MTAPFTQAHAVGLTAVDDLAGGGVFGSGMAISADGGTVTGFSDGATGFEGFRWKKGDTSTSLGPFGTGWMTSPTAINADGSVIVGYGNGLYGTEAFYWTKETGAVGLGDLPGGPRFSTAYGVSGDGRVIVGMGYNASSTEAFRWTPETGMQGLGYLPGGRHSVAYGVSRDGATIIGTGSSWNGTEAFRWTQHTGMTGLGDLPGGAFYSDARAVSADGSVIVGSSISAEGMEAFRWTAATGVQGLGDLPGGVFNSSASGVNGTGSVVVGTSSGISGGEAFYWTQNAGMQSLRNLLQEKGVDVAAWNFLTAAGVSADGNTVIGDAVTNGAQHVYVANLATGGITTSDSLGQSLAGVVQAGEQAKTMSLSHSSQTLFLAQNMQNMSTPVSNNTSAQSLAMLAPAAGGEKPVFTDAAFFALGTFGMTRADQREQTSWNGTMGLSASVCQSDWRVGFGVIGSAARTETGSDAQSRVDSTGGLLLASYQPEFSPLRIYGSVFMTALSLESQRSYENAGTLDGSVGNTTGRSYGVATRIGWLRPLNQDMSVMPYLEGRYSKTTIDGYIESGGGFPMTFSDRDSDHLSTRVGAEFTQRLHQRFDLVLRPAWGHRFSGNDTGFTASTGGITQDLRGGATDRDWIEASIGGAWRATDTLNVSAEVTGRTGDIAEPAASVTIGAFMRF